MATIPSTSYVLTNLYNQFPSAPLTITQEMLYTITAGTGNVITLFTISGTSPNFVYTRTVTTIPEVDGTYATGTTLSTSSPAYSSLVAGNNYYGNIVVFGRQYEAYWWVIDSTYVGLVGVLL